MVRVDIRLYGHLVQYLGSSSQDNRVTIDLEHGSSIKDLLRSLGLSSEMTHSLIILVNDQHGSQDYVLKDGDQVYLLPPIVGG